MLGFTPPVLLSIHTFICRIVVFQVEHVVTVDIERTSEPAWIIKGYAMTSVVLICFPEMLQYSQHAVIIVEYALIDIIKFRRFFNCSLDFITIK